MSAGAAAAAAVDTKQPDVPKADASAVDTKGPDIPNTDAPLVLRFAYVPCPITDEDMKLLWEWAQQRFPASVVKGRLRQWLDPNAPNSRYVGTKAHADNIRYTIENVLEKDDPRRALDVLPEWYTRKYRKFLVNSI